MLCAISCQQLIHSRNRTARRRLLKAASSTPFPHTAKAFTIIRLVGAIRLEQNDQWAVQRARYITLESIAPVGEDTILSLPIAPG